MGTAGIVVTPIQQKESNRICRMLDLHGVVIGFMLGLPLLQWLSSYSPTEPIAAPGTGSASSIDTTKASQSVLPSAVSANTSGIFKEQPSPNTPAGHYALSNTDIFKVDFQDPGWETVAQAAAGTGLPAKEVESFKTYDGHDLMGLDMDTVFGGTLVPQSSDLTWSEEDPDEGVFSHVDWTKRDIWLEDVTHARHQKTGTGKVAPFGGKSLIVQGKNVVDQRGKMLDWTTSSSHQISDGYSSLPRRPVNGGTAKSRTSGSTTSQLSRLSPLDPGSVSRLRSHLQLGHPSHRVQARLMRPESPLLRTTISSSSPCR